MTNLKPILLGGLILAAPALAYAQFSVGDTLPTDEAEIRATLEAQGYTVEEIEFEDGEIEVEAVLDGIETELVLNMTNGEIVDIDVEEEDDDD